MGHHLTETCRKIFEITWAQTNDARYTKVVEATVKESERQVKQWEDGKHVEQAQHTPREGAEVNTNQGGTASGPLVARPSRAQLIRVTYGRMEKLILNTARRRYETNGADQTTRLGVALE